jgi:sialic acid synthase SpsE
MQNSISHWQRLLLQEVEEKQLSPKQQNIAALRPPKNEIDPKDLEALRGGAKIESQGMDHEVSMANNSIESIIKAAMELKAKLGDDEKDIPAWIQDHITNAANFISQAADNYHEYSNGDDQEDKIPSLYEMLRLNKNKNGHK